LDDKYKLNPAYSFNIGKYKEPVSERAKVRGNDRLRFIYVYNVFQTKKYLFVECKFGNKFPAKRITPLETPIPTLNPIWYNTRSVLGIFDKIKGNLVFCKPTSTNNRLFTSGLYNDFDAGPRFFPQKQINDSTMAMFIEVKQLKEHIASDDFRKNNPKFPEKKEELEDLVNSLNEFDNPVLMFVTIKTPK
jgi:hypothetical protein